MGSTANASSSVSYATADPQATDQLPGPDAQPAGEAPRCLNSRPPGLITMGDPKVWDTWNELKETRRVEPDHPERPNEFISVQFSQAAHDRIARALH
jgi:hypothetical protein